MLLFFSGVENVPNGCTHVQRKEKIEVVVGANLNLFFFCRSCRTVVVVVVAYKLPFHSRPQSSSQLRYPASRGFSLAWLLAFTKWFASLVFVLYAPGSTSVTQTQALENKAQCASRWFLLLSFSKPSKNKFLYTELGLLVIFYGIILSNHADNLVSATRVYLVYLKSSSTLNQPIRTRSRVMREQGKRYLKPL